MYGAGSYQVSHKNKRFNNLIILPHFLVNKTLKI